MLDKKGNVMVKNHSEKEEVVAIPGIQAAIAAIDAEQKQQKQKGIQKVEINVARWAEDQTVVLNKRPDLYYIFARKDDPVEMAVMARRNYEPAVGNEIVFGMKEPTPGKPKILNNTRILMCCPKAIVDARNAAKLSRLQAQHQHGNKNKAAELQQAAGPKVGVSVFDGMEK